MTALKNWIRSEFILGMKAYDYIFMALMVMLQIVVFCIQPDSWVSIVAGIAGVISVVLCAQGKISFYFIGFIQNFSYMYLAWQNRFYGEVIENVFYIVTMIWGIFLWNKHLEISEEGKQHVQTKKFTIPQWIGSVVITVLATIGMGYWLNSIGSAQAYTDAATNVLAIFGQLLMVWRFREQWLWWLLIDIFCIKMWIVAGNWPMVAMYIAWTINCIYGWYNWSKENEVKECE